MIRIKIFGVDNVGLYVKATNKYFIYHSLIPSHKVGILRNELKVEPIPVPLINTLIITPFIACNSNGILIPTLFEEDACNNLKKAANRLGINFQIVDIKYNTLGNLILANDRGAIVSPIIPQSIRRIISDTLDVEVVTGTLGRFSYVGSLAVVNNYGGVITPIVKDDEINLAEEVLKVSLLKGTVNGGSEFISNGLIANDKGVIVGSKTTGKELMIITQALGT